VTIKLRYDNEPIGTPAALLGKVGGTITSDSGNIFEIVALGPGTKVSIKRIGVQGQLGAPTSFTPGT
jgi:hypothetical protein